MAVLYQAILIFLVMVYATILKINNLSDKYLIFALIAVILILVFARKFILPYKTKCRVCGDKLSFQRIFFFDDPLCSEHDEKEKKEKEEIRKKLDEIDSEEE